MSGEGSRALAVAEEPEANFWKDEGGRSNKLRMTVQHPDGSDLAVDVPLKFVLFYESGREVEKRDQNILNLCKPDYDPWIIPAGVGEVEIEFRLEKVSRRKDGQRFRISVEPDAGAAGDAASSPAAAPAFDVEGVQSRPVCVMSKRRTGERVVSRRAPTRAASVSSYGASQDDFEHVHSTLATVMSLAQSMKKVQDNTFHAVMTLSERVGKLEGAVSHVQQLMSRAQAPPMAAASAVPSGGAPLYHSTSIAASTAGFISPYGSHLRPVYGQLSQPISAMPSGPVAGTMPPAPPHAVDPQSSLPRQDSGPRRSGRRALKRDRSSGAASTSSLQAGPAGMVHRGQAEDPGYFPAGGSSLADLASRSAGAAAAAAAAKDGDDEDDDDDDEGALLSAAHAGAFAPNASGLGGAPMARLPSLSSTALDRLSSKEWDGLNALSSVAGAASAKRPRNE